MKINTDWSKPVSVEYGKDIIVRFSKEYCLVSVKITGDDGAEFTRSILGQQENIIRAYLINHIVSPVISFRTEFEPEMKVEIELRNASL